MPTQFETFGPCVPQVGTGTSDAMEVLGVCEDGGNIQITYLEQVVKSDAAGDAPADIQQMGSIATIEFTLSIKDTAVLAKVRRRSEAQGVTEGLGGVPGALLGTGAYLFALYLPSALTAPWTFPFCKLESYGGNYGTRYTGDKIRFKAIRFLPGTGAGTPGLSTNGRELYRRSA